MNLTKISKFINQNQLHIKKCGTLGEVVQSGLKIVSHSVAKLAMQDIPFTFIYSAAIMKIRLISSTATSTIC